MRIRDNDAEGEQPINMTSMMDVVFNLLIFFLVATTIAEQEREASLQLPRTSEARPLSAPPQQLIINIREDGSKIVSGRTYSDEELRGLLTKSAEEEPGRAVLIRADERSLHKYFAGVARICRQAGVNEVNIGYLLDQPQG